MERHETPEGLSDATLATILHFHATFNTHDVGAILHRR
jgi:hypothetical protein